MCTTLKYILKSHCKLIDSLKIKRNDPLCNLLNPSYKEIQIEPLINYNDQKLISWVCRKF